MESGSKRSPLPGLTERRLLSVGPGFAGFDFRRKWSVRSYAPNISWSKGIRGEALCRQSGSSGERCGDGLTFGEEDLSTCAVVCRCGATKRIRGPPRALCVAARMCMRRRATLRCILGSSSSVWAGSAASSLIEFVTSLRDATSSLPLNRFASLDVMRTCSQRAARNLLRFRGVAF